MNKESFDKLIIIDGLKLKTIEKDGECYFILPLTVDNIPGYQYTILTNEICPGLLPMRFVREDGILKAYFQWAGYVQIGTLYRRWDEEGKNIALESMGLLGSIIQALLSIENYLFISEGYILSADKIFTHPISGQVKLAFVPSQESQPSFSSRLKQLIRQTLKFTDDDQWQFYGDQIIEGLLKPEDSLLLIEKKLHDKSRSIFTTDWPKKRGLRDCKI